MQTSDNSKKWLYLLAFPIGHGAVDWGGGALWLLAPAMALSMDLSPFQVGVMFAARQIAAGIAYLPAGVIGDRLSSRGVFLLSTFWWVSVTQLVASSSENYWIVLGFLALANAGASAWHPVAMGAMTQWMPNRRGFVLGVHMMGGTVAEVAAPLMVGGLLMFLSWEQVLQISTIPSIVMGLIFIRLAPMVIAPAKELVSDMAMYDLIRLIMQPGTLLILLMIILHNMSIVAFMGMGPLYFQEVKGFSSGITGLAFSLFLVGGALAAPLVGHLSDRFGRKPIAIGGLVEGGICAYLVIFAYGNLVIFPLLIITGLLMLSNRSAIIAMALERIGYRESTVLGIISALGEGFAALGAILAGILASTDLESAIILAAILSISAGLVVLPVRKNQSNSRA